MNSSGRIENLVKALKELQAEIEPVKFDSENPYYKSRYASLGAIIRALKEVAPKHGLAFMQFPISGEDGSIGVETIVMHESGEWINQKFYVPLYTDLVPTETEAGKPIAYTKHFGKATVIEAGKTITYARRYGLASAFGLYADEDLDANEGEPEPKPKPKTKRAPAKPESTLTRPYSPEILKKGLLQQAKKEDEANPKQRQLVASILGQEFDSPEERHGFQNWIFGAKSMNNVEGRLVSAILRWLDLQGGDGEPYFISEMAKRELYLAKAEYIEATGQQSFDLSD